MSKKQAQPLNRTKNNNTPYVSASDIFGSEDGSETYSPSESFQSSTPYQEANTRKRRGEEEQQLSRPPPAPMYRGQPSAAVVPHGTVNDRVATPPPRDLDEAMADLGEATPLFDRL